MSVQTTANLCVAKVGSPYEERGGGTGRREIMKGWRTIDGVWRQVLVKLDGIRTRGEKGRGERDARRDWE